MAQQPVDACAVDLTTTALQAQEQLILQLRRNAVLPDNPQLMAECLHVRDSLRCVRSHLEGTTLKADKMAVRDDAAAQQLRQLLLMHVPQSVTADLREKFTELVCRALGSRWKKLLFVGLVTCPWYLATQSERGQQARHNKLLVVYVCHDELFYAPITEDDSEIFLHEGWLNATEVYHVIHGLVAGKVRFVEALFLPETVVMFADERWRQLQQLTLQSGITGLSGFLEQCRGQAVGSVGKKRKNGNMGMREGVDLFEFCESFRLLQHATAVLTGGTLDMNRAFSGADSDYYVAKDALVKLKYLYNEETCKTTDVSATTGQSPVHKTDLFTLVLDWRRHVDALFAKFKFTQADVVKSALGHWLGDVRLDGSLMSPDITVTDSGTSHLCMDGSQLVTLMQDVGGTVSSLNPQQIVLIARAGSHLYNLATPQSDVDYVVIYAEPTRKIASMTSRLSESMERRGPSKTVEYGAYEVRLLAEMLWKGSVVMLELLFAEDLEYTSVTWKALTAHCQLFLTENAILQYFGLIKNNMAGIKSGKYRETPRERKLFYQIFHKLHCLQFFLHRQCPQVRCEGEIRDFILGVKTGTSELSRDALVEEAQRRIDALREALAARSWRLPEHVNHRYLLNWMLDVRRITVTS